MGIGSAKIAPAGWQLLGRLSDWLRQKHEQRVLIKTDALGRRGEDAAHRYLRSRGYEILARRFRLADGSGEVDIIAKQGHLLVFVEVKTRSSGLFGTPERAIGPDKKRNIIRAARGFVQKAGADWSMVRFDVVSIVLGKQAVIDHFEDAFYPDNDHYRAAARGSGGRL